MILPASLAIVATPGLGICAGRSQSAVHHRPLHKNGEQANVRSIAQVHLEVGRKDFH